MEKNPRSFYRIRFSDCDPFGHLNNARYIDYFLNAREDHLKESYDIDLKNFYASGTSWVVGSHEILYRKPALYNERVCISSTLVKVLPDSLLVEMMMTDELQNRLKSVCWTSFIPVNVTTGKKENHSPAFMDFAMSVENNEIDMTLGIKGRENQFHSARN